MSSTTTRSTSPTPDPARRRPRIGVTLPTFGPHAGPEAIVTMARAADRLGLHSVAATERLLLPAGEGWDNAYGLPDAYVWEPIEVLTWAAAHTEPRPAGDRHRQRPVPDADRAGPPARHVGPAVGRTAGRRPRSGLAARGVRRHRRPDRPTGARLRGPPRRHAGLLGTRPGRAPRRRLRDPHRQGGPEARARRGHPAADRGRGPARRRAGGPPRRVRHGRRATGTAVRPRSAGTTPPEGRDPSWSR